VVGEMVERESKLTKLLGVERSHWLLVFWRDRATEAFPSVPHDMTERNACPPNYLEKGVANRVEGPRSVLSKI
jgi:hypothetical protein